MPEHPRTQCLPAPQLREKTRGVLSLSFDLELAWGTRRSATRNQSQGAEPARAAVRGILEILQRYEISATWATVGQLMRSPEDLQRGLFPRSMSSPSPAWFEGDWQTGIPDPDSPSWWNYFGPDLVEAIVSCPVYQELASHTFSHVVMGDPSCSPEVAHSELEAVQGLGDAWGRTIRSLVFPRNQIGHLSVVRQTGHTCYRGYNNEWYFRGPLHPTRSLQGVRRQIVRVLRLIDECFSVTPPVEHATLREGLWEIPHSMFFPGRSGAARWVPSNCLVRKAIRGLNQAARTGGIFSLYSHEHNFCSDLSGSLKMFEQICQAAAQLRDSGQLDICTMEEIADDLSHGRRPYRVPSANRRPDGELQWISIHTQPAQSVHPASPRDPRGDQSLDEVPADHAA